MLLNVSFISRNTQSMDSWIHINHTYSADIGSRFTTQWKINYFFFQLLGPLNDIIL